VLAPVKLGFRDGGKVLEEKESSGEPSVGKIPLQGYRARACHPGGLKIRLVFNNKV